MEANGTKRSIVLKKTKKQHAISKQLDLNIPGKDKSPLPFLYNKSNKLLSC